MATFTGALLPNNVLKGTFAAHQYIGMLVRYGGAAGGAAPAVAFVSPLAGSTIKSSTQLVVDVTDSDGDLVTICVSARFQPTGAEEVIWRINRFANQYSGSTRSSITNGFRFTLVRAGGWPATPTIQVDVVDATGGVA